MKERLESSPFLFAVLEESIVGFANFSNGKNDEAELLAIYVLPETQGKDIGSALLKHGIHMLSEITLSVCVEKKATPLQFVTM